MKPLHDVRVVDLGIITAGASTSAILADLGAEVIKIEGPDYIDPFRFWAGSGTVGRWWDTSPHYRFTNRNKQNLCVDLKCDEGRELLLDLVARSDVVVENFRVGVLDRLGLGFDILVRANPRIVLGSVSSQGTTGPEALAVSFGSTLEASSGMSSLIRYPDGAPQVSGLALNYPDQIASLVAAGFLVAALIEARTTGKPAHIDVSQREISSFVIGEDIVRAAHGGEAAAPRVGAPAVAQGVFAAADGRWVAVSVEDEVRDHAVRANGGPGCTDDAGLAAWVATRDSSEVVRHFRAAGAAAERVRTVAEMADPEGPARSGVAIVEGPDGLPVKGLPWILDGEPFEVHRAAPGLGADNHAVVVGLLERSEEDYAALVEAGVLADAPRTRRR